MSEVKQSNSDLETKIQRGHETTDAEIKPVLTFLLVLGALMVGVMFLMTGMYNMLESHFGRSEAALSPLYDAQQIPPGPRLQANPVEDLIRAQDWEEKRLNSYEWIDEDSGVFRIPIKRAMEIVAESGLPARSAE